MRNLDFVPWCPLRKSPLCDECPTAAEKQTQLLRCSYCFLSYGCSCAKAVLLLAAKAAKSSCFEQCLQLWSQLFSLLNLALWLALNVFLPSPLA